MMKNIHTLATDRIILKPLFLQIEKVNYQSIETTLRRKVDFKLLTIRVRIFQEAHPE